MHRWIALPITLIALAAALAIAPSARAAGLPPLPAAWPSTFQLGLSGGAGSAAGMRATAQFGFRYQYLAGGVNTGNGWANWNPNGTFVTNYVQESSASAMTSVFSYYMLRQSAPGGADDGTAISNNLQNAATMKAYLADIKLFMQRAASSQRVILHFEPDLWGFVEQHASGDNATTVPVKVGSSGLAEVAGIPDNAAGLANAVLRLRDLYAPNVLVAYHLSVWGTGNDILYTDPSDVTVDALAARAVSFYRSLGATFDVSFSDPSDRDAAFKQFQYGDGGAAWWSTADYARNVRFIGDFVTGSATRMVLWQVPLGNTKMRAQNNTWGHYQDNHVEYFIDDPTRAHLALYANAGVVAALFGGGAGGTTCACDGDGDGVTNPAAINGNTIASYNSDDDGGFFRNRATAYYASGAYALPVVGTPVGPTPTPTLAPTPVRTPTPTPAPTPVPTPAQSTPPPVAGFSSAAGASPATAFRGDQVAITAAVRSGAATTCLVDIEVYAPNGAKVGQVFFDTQSFAAGQTRTYTYAFAVGSAAAYGTYTVKVGIFSVGWGTLRNWNNSAGQFVVAPR